MTSYKYILTCGYDGIYSIESDNPNLAEHVAKQVSAYIDPIIEEMAKLPDNSKSYLTDSPEFGAIADYNIYQEAMDKILDTVYMKPIDVGNPRYDFHLMELVHPSRARGLPYLLAEYKIYRLEEFFDRHNTRPFPKYE